MYILKVREVEYRRISSLVFVSPMRLHCIVLDKFYHFYFDHNLDSSFKHSIVPDSCSEFISSSEYTRSCVNISKVC